MALIRCPECNKNVNDKSKPCPYCGCPPKYFVEIADSSEKNVKEQVQGDFRAKDSDKRGEETVENSSNKKACAYGDEDYERECDRDMYLLEKEIYEYLDEYNCSMALSNYSGWFYADHDEADVEIYKDEYGNIVCDFYGRNYGMRIIDDIIHDRIDELN